MVPTSTSNRLSRLKRNPQESLSVFGRKSSAPRPTPLTVLTSFAVITRPVCRFTNCKLGARGATSPNGDPVVVGEIRALAHFATNDSAVRRSNRVAAEIQLGSGSRPKNIGWILIESRGRCVQEIAGANEAKPFLRVLILSVGRATQGRGDENSCNQPGVHDMS